MPDQPKDSGQQVPAPTGGEVERYAPRFVRSFDARSAVVEMMHDPIGEWVRYEDYEKLKDENDVWRTLFAETFEDAKKLGYERIDKEANIRDLQKKIDFLESRLDGRLL